MMWSTSFDGMSRIRFQGFSGITEISVHGEHCCTCGHPCREDSVVVKELTFNNNPVSRTKMECHRRGDRPLMAQHCHLRMDHQMELLLELVRFAVLEHLHLIGFSMR